MFLFTVSQGVNFPAHLVIIKSTQHYIPGKGYVEIEEMDMKQMIGRAGRPQFDKTATAVIMTSKKSEYHWSTFANSSSRPIESTLLGQLKEHIVAEAVLGSITSTSGAIQWLQSTYLWQRVQKNPAYYGLSRGLGTEKLCEELRTICLRDLRALQDAGLIELKTVDGAALAPTELGAVMARYYVLFETMCEFQKVTSTSGTEHLIDIIAGAKEFCDVRLRVSEKRILNELNANRAVVKYPLTGSGSTNPSKFRVKTDREKVNLLIQSTLGGYEFKEDFGLRQDVQNVFRCAGRLSRCLRQVITITQNLQYYTPLFSSISLAKCIERRLWDVNDDSSSACATPAIFRQLASIGPTLAHNLYADAGLRTFDDLRGADPSLIERACGRKPPFGANLKIQVADLVPKLNMNMKYVGSDEMGGGLFQVNVRAECGKVENSVCVLVVGNSRNRVLLCKKIVGGSGKECEFNVCTFGRTESVTASLISESFVGVDVFETACCDGSVKTICNNNVDIEHTSHYFAQKSDKCEHVQSKKEDFDSIHDGRNDDNDSSDSSDEEDALKFFLDYGRKEKPKKESKKQSQKEAKRVVTTPVKSTVKSAPRGRESALSGVKRGSGGEENEGCGDSLNQFFRKKKYHSPSPSPTPVVKKKEMKEVEEETVKSTRKVLQNPPLTPIVVPGIVKEAEHEPIQKVPKTELQIQYDSMFDNLFG